MQNRSGSDHQPSPTTTRHRETVHDLRNLFCIVASAKHLLERNPARSQRQALLDALEDAATRGGRLTTHLLAGDPVARNYQLADIGMRLVNLAPMLQALSGSQITLHADIAVPHAQVRMIGDEFDAAILELVANAVAAGARNIAVRNRVVGAHVWTLVSDDGRGMCRSKLAELRHGQDTGGAHGGGLSRIHRFARRTHGRLLVRSCLGTGTSTALILPTMLSSALKPGAPHTNRYFSPEKNIHVDPPQQTTA